MNHPTRILIVDSDPIAGPALMQTLAAHGYELLLSISTEAALQTLDQEQAAADRKPIGVVIADQDVSGANGGIELIRQLHDAWPGVIPVVLSGYRKIESAVHAMRFGAADYLLKPVIETELVDAVERATQRHLLLATAEPQEAVAKETQDDAGHDTPAGEPDPKPELRLSGEWSPMPLSEAMKEPEKRILLSALQANGWNRQETARQLEINRTTLYKKIRQYRLDEPA